MAVKIKIRRSTSAEWASSLSILDQGELGLDTTLNKLKAGNGINLWSALPFINILPSELSELAQDAVESALTAGTGITKTYNDTANTITLAVDSTIATKIYADGKASDAQTAAALDATTKANNAKSGAETTSATALASHEADATNIHGIADTSALATKTYADNAASTAVAAVINSAPEALNTLKELADALTADESTAALLATLVGTKAPLASPTFTGTVSGITKTMVGLGSVDNTTDAAKPISTATQTALDLKSNISDVASPKTVAGASYTLDIIDSTKTLVTTAASGDVTITVPTNSSVNFPLGSTITLFQAAAGRIIVSPANGVTLKSFGDFQTFKNRFSFSFITLYQYAANSWAVVGDLTA